MNLTSFTKSKKFFRKDKPVNNFADDIIIETFLKEFERYKRNKLYFTSFYQNISKLLSEKNIVLNERATIRSIKTLSRKNKNVKEALADMVKCKMEIKKIKRNRKKYKLLNSASDYFENLMFNNPEESIKIYNEITNSNIKIRTVENNKKDYKLLSSASDYFEKLMFNNLKESVRIYNEITNNDNEYCL